MIYQIRSNKLKQNRQFGDDAARRSGFDRLLDGIFHRKRFSKTELRMIESERKDTTRRMFSVALLSFGGIGALLAILGENLEEHLIGAAFGVPFLAFGLWLFKISYQKVKLWDKYDSYIRWNGNTSLKYIAENMGKSVDEVCEDLQDMINKNFLVGPSGNLVAIIDRDYEMLIMTDYETGKPFETVADTSRRMNQREVKAAVYEEVKPKMPEPVKPSEPKESANVSKIREVAKEVPDRSVKKTLNEMADTIDRIENTTKKYPEMDQIPEVKQFKSTYLPQTMKLIDKYRNKEGNSEVLSKMEDMFVTLAEAFENTEDKLYEKDNFNTLVNLDVMESSLKKSGLLDSDFEVR